MTSLYGPLGEGHSPRVIGVESGPAMSAQPANPVLLVALPNTARETIGQVAKKPHLARWVHLPRGPSENVPLASGHWARTD